MVFVLLNIDNEKEKIVLKSHRIDSEHTIQELVIDQGQLIHNLRLKKSFFNNVKKRLYDKKIVAALKRILKNTKSNDSNYYYVLGEKLSDNTECSKYIVSKLEMIGWQKYIQSSEMDNNLSMYIKEYLDNHNLNEHETKVLLVYKDLKNINFDIIAKSIKLYKTVNIYLAEKPTTIIFDKINEINKQEGTSIEIVRYSKKAFLEFDVVYYADDVRVNYPRMRLQKNALVLDELDAQKDKYNSNVIFFNNFKEKANEIDNLKEQYGLLKVAAIVRKIVN